MISTFRFTDNVQRNISRYVQVNKYGDCRYLLYGVMIIGSRLIIPGYGVLIPDYGIMIPGFIV